MKILPNTLPPLSAPTQHDPKVVAAAQGMEAMFLNQLMQAMRKTVEQSEFSLESPGSNIYRSLLDAEFADRAARTGGVGFADLIIESLESRGYNSKSRVKSPRKAPESANRTGGTDESSNTDDRTQPIR